MHKTCLEDTVAAHIIEFKERYYRLAYSYVKNSEDAMDIVQESIYKAFSSLDSLENPSYIKTWFYRIVVNTSVDILRKRKREILANETFLSSIDEGEYDSYENFDLKTALDSLPENYRTIIILRYFEDLKLQEIADVLNENVNTVKTRLYAGLKKLRIAMDEKNEEVLI
ncbi:MULTISPECIES: sigma-70 family RNA polymerase sigma factor [Tepidanaerobacter]|uniref:sigma-70 family RNA polymerase sigma factor n=1 Tax=Tepidanaerobacter TaxID=499228 RepID=UPI000A53D7A6|nr:MULTISPECIES: sigma-70 family RNA polymerase sigma factor [Tepidanaerobacter]